MGYLAVLWGQVDFLMDEILMFAHEFDEDQRKLFLTDKPMGGKADMLAKVMSRLPDDAREHAKAFHAAIQATKQRRNSAFHGVWGWRIEKRSKLKNPASFHHTTKDNPVRATDLRKLAEELTKCTQDGSRAMCALRGFKYSPAGQFVWGGMPNEKGQPPEWIAQSGKPFRKGRSPRDRRTAEPDTPPKADRE